MHQDLKTNPQISPAPTYSTHLIIL